MQQVEAAVGHDDPLPGLAQPPQLALQLLEGDDFVLGGGAGHAVGQLGEDLLPRTAARRPAARPPGRRPVLAISMAVG